VPKAATHAVFGPWHFAVTAAPNREFREVYGFQTRTACQESHRMMAEDITRVVAEHGATTAGRIARRLRLGGCETTRRAR
jgi:hypothetical protein